ncbi:MAG TPA: DsbA family protein, partial [Thermoplasmata archaeon]|nr:DsbA family protein [Thermoplasmata archaeon]
MASAEPPPVVAVHYADPWCVWTWGLEPALRRVEAVFGPAVRVDYRIAGAIEHIAEWRRKMELEGPALIDWLKESMARTGNPADPECLAKESFSSSFGACLAVTAAQRLDPVRAPHYLRRLMEYLQVRGLPAD